MLGDLVSSDLQLNSIADSIPFQTSWGKQEFTEGLHNCSDNKATIKRKQITIMSFYTEPKLTNEIRKELSAIKTNVIDDAIHPKEAIVTESISQVLWKPESTGSFLNSSPLVLNGLITWKTILLPAFAILMPLLALIIPFFVLQYYKSDLGSTEYIEHIRTVILSQISVPQVLKSKTADDRIGFVLESLFIGGTLAMYISSLWNQIAASLHLRNIWHTVAERGSDLQTLRTTTKRILELCKTLPLRKQRALRVLLDAGDSAIQLSASMETLDGVSTYGTVWNDTTAVQNLKAWLSRIDVFTSIASLSSICFPRIQTGTPSIDIQGVYHPGLEPCISNNFQSAVHAKNAHTVLTGPNRGGKSTFCKAVALSIVTAQSWGFAWASRMNWTPFRRILTALESTGKLGELSTFEAEIEFAKRVLEEDAPLFVIMDEIFHSTNAGDGVAASRVFMDRFYQKPDVVSIISTHYKELVSQYTGKAQMLQLVTNEKDGKLDYTYKVAPGISEKSSVMEILEERGLFSL